MKAALYRQIARALAAYRNCIDMDEQTDWQEIWADRLGVEVPCHLPSGSGFDAGADLDLDSSTPDKLVFTTSFHHMDEHGGYDGWTTHTVVVTASLAYDFKIRVTGRDRNDIKNYIAETFNAALTTEMDWVQV